MRQKLLRTVQPGLLALFYGLTELGCVPINDHSSKEIETCHSIVLAFCGSVLNLSLATNAQCILQGVMRLTFVQTSLCTTLHVRIEQPINDEQSAFDAADLPKGDGQFVLTWIRRKLS